MKINGTNLTMIRGDTEAIKLTVKNKLGEVIPYVSNLVVKTTPQATGLTWATLEDMARQLGLIE